MLTTEITVDTSGRRVADITEAVQSFAAEAGGDGLLHAFLLHATCGLALIEIGAGSEHDLGEAIDRLLPPTHPYRHRHGSPGHGADHVLPAFISPSLTLPVRAGHLHLGTWQSLVIVDPNESNNARTLHLTFLPA